MFYVKPEDGISCVELGNRLQLNAKRKCLWNKKLFWFGNLKRMADSFLATKHWRLMAVLLDEDLEKYGVK